MGQTRHFNLKEVPPMQPWAEEKYKAVREGLGPTGKGRIDLDPAIRDCVPHGFPRILNSNSRSSEKPCTNGIGVSQAARRRHKKHHQGNGELA